jgi:uracil-DNA glycosylase
MMSVQVELKRIHGQLEKCRKCPSVCGTPVHGPALETQVLLLGQAPGTHEARLGRPFAYTAGKTLFKWLHEAVGSSELEIREMIYFAAVARCFPGKSLSGTGDRLPNQNEIENCRPHLQAEVQALKPKLILAVGKLAMQETLSEVGFNRNSKLDDFVGRKFKTQFHGQAVTVIPLPHPSGISRWPKVEPGKSKLAKALRLIRSEISHFS